MTTWTRVVQVHILGLCALMSYFGFHSRMSTTCSTWCVPREPRPAPQSPTAAMATKLRRIPPAPRWLIHFLLFHQEHICLRFLNVFPVHVWFFLFVTVPSKLSQSSHRPPQPVLPSREQWWTQTARWTCFWPQHVLTAYAKVGQHATPPRHPTWGNTLHFIMIKMSSSVALYVPCASSLQQDHPINQEVEL